MIGGWSNEREASMRMISVPVTVLLLLVSSATLAQQQAPGTFGDSIGHPPPLPGPPPVAGPPATAPSTGPVPQTSSPSTKGYIGAYAPASDNAPAPVFKGPLPEATTGPGLDKVAEDGVSTRTVKAVSCSRFARETDGTTTCIGIPDEVARRKRR
jgi:hypothetical protein